jgi:hypothetical protein
MDESRNDAAVRCPACGAWQSSDGFYCVACGMPMPQPQPYADQTAWPAEAPGASEPLLEVDPAEVAHLAAATGGTTQAAEAAANRPYAPARAGDVGELAAMETAVTAVPGGAPLRAGADAVDRSEDERRCQWCGTRSPAESDRCTQCGAMFPRPEQDEALLRASEERIRAATESIDLMRRRRAKRGFGRLFDG